MALDLIPYHKKNVLIIEDLAEMRSSMKSMLASLGVQKMETVNNGEEALTKIAYNRYDIVFSDYELGRGKDGQQILEEVRHSGLIPASTVYIMVTAAQTVEMVMGALEFEPDGYITKPVTLEILRTRLNRIIRTKDVYREINRAIDKKDINGALEACNRLAVEKPKFALPAYRIKGKLLIGEKRYDEARDIYDTVLGIKRVAWAVLGMGKVEYYQGNYDAAQTLLESLAKTKSKYVEAFDWLSKVLEAQGKFKAAQTVLRQAVEESPKAVVRQQELARLAELNGDMETMYKACRKASGLSRNSVFRNAENMIRYAKSLQAKIKHGSMRDQKIATSEAFSLIENAKTEFHLNLSQMVKCGLVEAQTLFNAGKQLEGRMAYRAVRAMIKEDSTLSLDDQLDVLVAKLQFEDEADSTAYSQSILQKIGGDRRLQTKYYNILDFHLSKNPEARLALLKKRGAELLGIKDFEEAWEVLYKATRLPCADVDCQLDALKAVVNLYKQGDRSQEHLNQANELFALLQNMDSGDPRYPTLEKLRLLWAEQSSDDSQTATG
ncbi:MAG: response regulator [Pseudomonadota bacterium]|nr:response regulator [Pseudomonadota bacterium]